MLVGGGVTPAVAAATPNPGCSIGVDNVSVMVNTSFATIQQSTMPSSVQQTPTITATCKANASLPSGTYRWVMQIQDLQDQVVQGTTNKSVIDALKKAFSLSKLTLETNNGPPGYTPVYSDSAVATLTVSNLTSKVGVGQYLFIQHIAVQRQICTWTGSKLNCANDGGQKTFAANFTLNVVAQSAPSTGSGSGGVQACATPWAEGNTFTLGEVVSYESKNYKNIQPHTAYAGTGWTPPSTPALWSYVADCTTGSGGTGTGGSTTPATPVRHIGVVPNPWTVNHGAARARMRCDCF